MHIQSGKSRPHPFRLALRTRERVKAIIDKLNKVLTGQVIER